MICSKFPANKFHPQAAQDQFTRIPDSNGLNVQFQRITILPRQKRLQFPGGWGFSKTKTFLETYHRQAYWNFQSSGGEDLKKNPSCGGVIDVNVSGTEHFNIKV